MANKRDGTPQEQRGGRKVMPVPMKDITDPKVALGLHSKYGIGAELPTTLTPAEKDLFQKVTHINWERFQEKLAPKLFEAADAMATRLADPEENKKIPINFVALNLSQVLSSAKQLKDSAGPSTVIHNNTINIKPTKAGMLAELFGSAIPAPLPEKSSKVVCAISQDDDEKPASLE